MHLLSYGSEKLLSYGSEKNYTRTLLIEALILNKATLAKIT